MNKFFTPKLIFLFAFSILSFLIVLQPLLKFYTLHSNIADLGFFISNISNVRVEWWRAFTGHVQPLMILYGYIYYLLPVDLFPYVLLASQSIILILSSFLIFRNYGRLPSIVFLLYYPLWNNALFDFHFDHLSILFILLFFINLKNNKVIYSIIFALLLMLIKETFALQTIFCGFYLILISLIYQKFNIKFFTSGLFLSIIGCLYFYICMNIILKYFSQNSETLGVGSSAFSWLGNNYFDVIKYLLFNILDVLIRVFSNIDKLKYIFVIFSPLLFIPLLRPLPLLVAVPPLAISLLSNLNNYYDYTNHYSAGLISPLIISFCAAYSILIRKFNKKFIAALVISASVFILFLLGSTPISRLFWSSKVWAYNYNSYLFTKRDSEISSLIYKYIPSDPLIVVSSQNNLNSSLISSRLVILPFPSGVLTSYSSITYNNDFSYNFLHMLNGTVKNFPYNYSDVFADYVLVDINRPHFILDKGCNWIYGKCMDIDINLEYNNIISNMKVHYSEIASYDGFYIFKRIY